MRDWEEWFMHFSSAACIINQIKLKKIARLCVKNKKSSDDVTTEEPQQRFIELTGTISPLVLLNSCGNRNSTSGLEAMNCR